MGGSHSAGKGDRYRSVDMNKYRENYEKIFGKKKGKTNDNDRKTNKRRGNSRKGD